MTPSSRPSATPLVDALTALRDEVAGAAFPLDLPTAAPARRRAAATVDQLDDYLIPRLRRLDAPLLVVVGGSTGAGKSTLVNSLVQAPVTPTGVLRPTTRGPVLVCHPVDAEWFTQARLLPTLPRARGGTTNPTALRIVKSTQLTPGLAILDAPDIDSVVERNRALAEQLLAAADLWLFVTSAARYADAVPWGFLATARDRGTAIALVLDRVPPGGEATISGHLREMLDEHGLGDTSMFVVAEERGVTDEQLPPDAVAPIAEWLAELARDADQRADVVRRTVAGALAALDPTVDALAGAVDDQAGAVVALHGSVDAAYRRASDGVAQAVRDGSLLRGEVLARWQQLIGTGEFMRGLQAWVGRARDRLVAAVTGQPSTQDTVREAIESELVVLVRAAVSDGAHRAATAWRAHPAGAALLREHPALGDPDPAMAESVDRDIRDWQRDVVDLVRAEAGSRARFARLGAYAVNALGLAVMIVVFTATAFIPTGAEVAVAGGTTVAAQKVLEAIFGDQAVRRLAEQARTRLLERVDALLNRDADRFRTVLTDLGIDGDRARRLRAAAAEIASVRAELDAIADRR